MIRRLKEGEIMDIMPVFYRKCCEWSEGSGIKTDSRSLIILLNMAIHDSDRVIFVNDNLTGLAMARMQTWPMDLTVHEVHEMMIACEPDEEIFFRKAIDAWAKERGCSIVILSCFEEAAGKRFRRVN